MEESRIVELIRELIRRTDRLIFVYDVNAASLLFLNSVAGKIWQRTRESIMLQPSVLLNTIHPDDKESLRKKYKDLLNGIILNKVEFRILLPDKTERWIQVSPQLILMEQNRKIIAGLGEDITNERDNVESLQKFAAKKNSILEILSHDLAGSLGMIQSLSGTLAESVKESDNDDTKSLIRLIHESSARSVLMIREFVQQEFLESSNAGLVKKRVDLVRKMREVLDQYKEGEDVIKKEIHFSASGSPIFVNMDENKFMQVINNLISNSIKFTHDGGIIAAQVEEKDDSVIIMIKDNGIGIPEKYHHELFDKFTRARRDGLKGEPSTGLGMSIIKTIIEWHNGKIWFDSKENEGSTFYIEIPKV